MKNDRIRHVSAAGIALIMLLVSTLPAWSADAKMVEEAKKERRVVWYTGITNDVNSALTAAFEKKYPFLKVEVFRSTTSRLLARAEAEASSGKNLWDVISYSGFPTYVLKKKNMLANYVSPEAISLPKEFMDPDGYWSTLYKIPVVMGYNTKLIAPKEVPKRYEDLLDPKWKKKMAFDPTDVEWFANLMKIKGESGGLAFMKQLFTQDIRLVEGHSSQTLLLAAGEFSLGITLYIHPIEKIKAQGGPIDWMPLEPVITYIHAASISAKAPHGNGARLLVDFLLSREGQEILARYSNIVAHPEIPPIFEKPVQGIKLTPSDISLADEFTRYRKLLNDIIR